MKTKHPYSFAAIVIVAFCLTYTSMFFYPKWKKKGSEATIGWDVSGYYHYLPAIFIYKDLKQLGFQNDILKSYRSTPELQQSFQHHSGNYVMKYSCGQALQMLPFFAVGHMIALSNSNWKADGYSRPYQFMISFGALLTAFIGLIFLRKFLIIFFDDKIVGISLLLLCMGSNYLEYAGITGAMTHNGLFTLCAILLYVSYLFYKRPEVWKCITIGAVIGLMALTRPTEIISVIIPLTFGLGVLSKDLILERLRFFRDHYKFLLFATIICGLVGSLQLIYWKYVSGEWIVYSYQEQGFSWLKPHLYDGLLSYRSGWLTYSPVMIFSIIGFFFLRPIGKHRFNFTLLYFMLFTYIAFAWDIWWYGGSLGQRTMVQIYPVLAVPFSFFIKTVLQSKRWIQVLVSAVSMIFIYFNCWLVFQAHGGKMLLVGQMTKAYFWRTAGTWNYRAEDLKLLDNDEVFYGDLEKQGVLTMEPSATTGDNDGCYHEDILQLDANCQFSNEVFFNSIPKDKKWIRASAKIKTNAQEWNHWLMTQMTIRYYDSAGEVIKTNMIRPARLLTPGEEGEVYLDSKIPNKKIEKMGLLFWHAGGNKKIWIRDIKVVNF